jgi:hypothetical protein
VPVSVDVSLGRQSKVKLARAVLLYQEGRHQGDAFATVHEVMGVDDGRPALAPGQLLTVEGLREIHKALYRVQRLEVLPPHVLAASPERLVWFEPARNRVMFYSAGDTYLDALSGQSFPQPPLLFIAGERSLKVLALGENERPTGSSPVYTAPYYNTDHRGVCLGSMRNRELFGRALPLRFHPRHLRTLAQGLGRIARRVLDTRPAARGVSYAAPRTAAPDRRGRNQHLKGDHYADAHAP